MHSLTAQPGAFHSGASQPAATPSSPWPLRKHDTFVHVCVTENSLNAEVLQALGSILVEQKAQGIRRVLLEEDIKHFEVGTPQVLTALESLRLFDCFDLRVALFTQQLDRMADLRFVETAAVNRGYDMKAFSDVGPALEWLLQAT
jgi:hypothetical protein